MWKIFWLIWFVLSAFVLAVYGWSLRILYQQKKAWKSFAEKHKLDYKSEKISGPPYITGRYKDYRLYAYTGVQATNDFGGQRYVTIVEIELGQGVPVAGAAGTKSLGNFILGLNFEQEFVPNSKYWSADYVLKTRSAAILKSYLNEDRLKALHGIFSMKNSSVLYFFDEVESVLRIETADPLRDPDRLEKIMDRLYKLLSELRLSEKEYNELAKELKDKGGLPGPVPDQEPQEDEAVKPDEEVPAGEEKGQADDAPLSEAKDKTAKTEG